MVSVSLLVVGVSDIKNLFTIGWISLQTAVSAQLKLVATADDAARKHLINYLWLLHTKPSVVLLLLFSIQLDDQNLRDASLDDIQCLNRDLTTVLSQCHSDLGIHNKLNSEFSQIDYILLLLFICEKYLEFTHYACNTLFRNWEKRWEKKKDKKRFLNLGWWWYSILLLLAQALPQSLLDRCLQDPHAVRGVVKPVIPYFGMS